jgi:hypothetical protein
MKFILFDENKNEREEVSKDEFSKTASLHGVSGKSVSFYDPETKKGGFVSDIWR